MSPAQAEAPKPVVPVVAAVAGVNGTTCSFYPACVAAGITEGDCCPNADQVRCPSGRRVRVEVNRKHHRSIDLNIVTGYSHL